MLLLENSPQNVSPIKMLSTSSSLNLFFDQQSTYLWPFRPQVWISPLKQVFILFYFLVSQFSFPQKSDALWPQFPQLLDVPLKNLLFFCFFSPEFRTRNFSLGSGFFVSCFRLALFSIIKGFPFWGTFMSFLISWHFKIFSQVCILLLWHQIHVPSSHLYISHIFPLFYWVSNLNYIVHLIICHGLGLCSWSCMCSPWFLTPFKLSCFSYDVSYFLMSVIKASFASLLKCLAIPKGIYVRLVIRKSQALMFPSYIFRRSASSCAYYYLVIYIYIFF